MNSEPALDPKLCPVCGARNDCAVENGSREPCWCSNVEISAAALARIPDAARDRACLCPRCAAFALDASAGE